jgi:peptidoglycan hydrolase CwlO-like protein
VDHQFSPNLSSLFKDACDSLLNRSSLVINRSQMSIQRERIEELQKRLEEIGAERDKERARAEQAMIELAESKHEIDEIAVTQAALDYGTLANLAIAKEALGRSKDRLRGLAKERAATRASWLQLTSEQSAVIAQATSVADIEDKVRALMQAKGALAQLVEAESKVAAIEAAISKATSTTPIPSPSTTAVTEAKEERLDLVSLHSALTGMD